MRGARGQLMICALLILAIFVAPRAARAEDQVAQLTKMLSSSSSDKVRQSAVVALGRLGDKRTLKPLVAALADPAPQIRGIAAAALGKLGHKAALPSLRNMANDDPDPDVRTLAKQAAIAVARANQLPNGFEDTAPAPSPALAAPKKAVAAKSPTAPDVYVTINTAADDSGTPDKPTRQVHADIVRAALADQCHHAERVTTTASEAARFGLDPRHVDLSVTKLDVTTTGAIVEVEAQLRLAISDGKGKMLSFLSGGAKVQVPKGKFDARYLPNLRREALENAMRGMFDKLLAHLRGRPQS